MSTYLPRLLRSMREGAQGGAPSDIQEDASGLMSGTSLAFHVNQVIQPLFLHLIFLLHYFFLI